MILLSNMSYFIATGNAIMGALTGNYPVSSREDLARADAIIGFSFGNRERGTETLYGRVNHELAKHALFLGESGLPMYLQEEVADAAADRSDADIHRIEGNPSSVSGGGLDSWAVLKQAFEIARGDGRRIERPIVVAQRYHISRIGLQLAKMTDGDVLPLLPPDMPKEFAPDSEQSWTRDYGKWVRREIPGLAALKLLGRA